MLFIIILQRKLHSTTGLLYNFVTNKKLPTEAPTLHQDCPWDTLHINWRDVTLTNGESSIRLPCNVQVPLKKRLSNLMRGPDCTVHLMTLQGHTWYSQHHPPALPSHAAAFFFRVKNPLPPSQENEEARPKKALWWYPLEISPCYNMLFYSYRWVTHCFQPLTL